MRHSSTKGILVVEDDWFLAESTAEAVRSAGHLVIGPFACPVEAETRLASDPADAALLDIGVVDGTTFDLARTLCRAGVPVVFHSEWLAAALPPDLAGVPLVPRWRGADTAVATLMPHIKT